MRLSPSHHSSVYSVATMFHDISLTPKAPQRVAVVRKKAELGPYLGILNHVGQVIELDAANDTYAQLIEAA